MRHSPVERIGLMAYLFVMYGGIPDNGLVSAAYDGRLDAMPRERHLAVIPASDRAPREQPDRAEEHRAA